MFLIITAFILLKAVISVANKKAIRTANVYK